MSDECDMASDTEAFFLKVAMASMAPTPEMALTGFCHNCGEPSDAAYCDADCRDDHRVRLDARKRNGVVE